MNRKYVVGFLVLSNLIMGYFLWDSYHINKTTTYPVLCAEVDIAAGQVIDDSMLKYHNIDSNLYTLTKDDLLGKIAAVSIPANSIISTGIEVPRTTGGSLLHIPVTIDTAGMINPGDDVYLFGKISKFDSESSVFELGHAHILALIDSKGHINKFTSSADGLPVVFIAEVDPSSVIDILNCIQVGQVFPVLGYNKEDDHSAATTDQQ